MGELYMRSPHMAAGYLGLDDATKQKFLQNPFNPTNPRDRLYRTGDIGRYLPDGIGRKSHSSPRVVAPSCPPVFPRASRPGLATHLLLRLPPSR